MPNVDRRRFLAGVGALAAAPAARRLAVGPRAQPAPAPFAWGVASFDPTPDAVLLWTRVTPADDTVELGWTVATDERLVQSGSVEVGPDSDWCARVEVTGLPAGQTWTYRFTTPDGTHSPFGRTRTLPTDTERLRVGVVSCGRLASAGFAAYRALAERDVDVVVHLGDYIYEDGLAGARAHEPAERLTRLDQYRARYAQHRADPDLQALHARHPMVAVWDDHEVAGNAWRDGAASHDDARDGPWLDRLLAAGRAHAEWLPGRTAVGPDGRLRAWRAIDLGGLAELVVLDTRTWGRDRQPATEAELAPGTPTRTMLGADQADFAIERLSREDGPPWVLVANQVMYHPLRVPAVGEMLAGAARAGGFLVADGLAVNPDQWDGYADERELLNVRGMGARGGVVVLSGDVHSSWAWEGPANSGGDPVMVELVAPSVSSEPFAERLPLPPALVEAGVRTLDPELSYIELSSHGYLLVDCTPDRVQGEWWYVDPDDVTTQRFGAARSAPIEVPMRLTEELEPTTDRDPGSAPVTAPTLAPPTSAPSGDGGDDPPWPIIGAGAAAGAAAVAALVAVRRRSGATTPSEE